MKLTIALLALAAIPSVGLAVEDPDPVTTCVVVIDATSTRTEPIRPFRPLSTLKQKLGSLPAPNQSVVKALLEYPRDGSHDYWWPRKKEGPAYDGVTTDILLDGVRVLKGEPKGRTFCCGLTLEVLLAVLPTSAKSPVTTATADQFKELWFCKKFQSPGPEDAMLAFGIGEKVAPDDALPGDFVQIWRNNKSGHSVVFVDWALDEQGKRVGMHYWSTQEGTKGINFRVEPIGTGGKTMDMAHTSITRLLPEEKWSKPAQTP